MAVVIEKINEADAKKYGFEERYFGDVPIRKSLGFSAYKGFKWAIDRDRNAYIVKVDLDRDADPELIGYYFYLNGNIYFLWIATEYDLARKPEETVVYLSFAADRRGDQGNELTEEMRDIFLDLYQAKEYHYFSAHFSSKIQTYRWKLEGEI